MGAPFYIALLHYPVLNKNGEVVVTSIANFDLHDVARCARTYRVKGYYIINPVDTQKYLAKRIIAHWQNGYGAEYNPDRSEAFTVVRFCDDLATTLAEITEEAGAKPKLIVTDAKRFADNVSNAEMRKQIETSQEPFLLLFGTGWGLTEEILEMADYKLAPILGNDEFNHLSVRSATAIILDRLKGVDR